MSDVLLVYVTFDNIDQAKQLAKTVMEERLCACVNIYPHMEPMFFWPPKSNTIDDSKEVVMILKTLESKYSQLEKRIEELHSYDVPCILAIPIKYVGKKYYEWLQGEINVI